MIKAKFYLINLEKDTAKLEWCKKVIGDRFEFEVFKAIEVGEKEDIKNFKTKGEYGCFQSHMKVMEKCLKEKDSYDLFFIMEDDILFVENFDKYFNDVVDKLVKTDYDVCLFYDWSKTDDLTEDIISLKKTDSLYLHFYAIHPNKIGKMLWYGNTYWCPLDYIIKHESSQGNINAITTSKILVKQNRFFDSALTGYGFRGELNGVLDCVYPYDDMYSKECELIGKWKLYKTNFRDILEFFIDGSVTCEQSKLTGGRWRMIHNEVIITFLQPEVFEIIYLKNNKVYSKMPGESWDTMKTFIIKEGK
jgi:hypothetical protein